MEYTCTITHRKRKETWRGCIHLIFKYPGLYEAEIIGRGTRFHIIAGSHRYGNYMCIPNHNVGSELSEYTDLFWNTEQLSRIMKKVDAVTVATGLCYLEKIAVSDEDIM